MTPREVLASGSSTDPREDNEVDEGDWTGESKGDADTELEEEDGVDSDVIVRDKAALRGLSWVDMLRLG